MLAILAALHSILDPGTAPAQATLQGTGAAGGGSARSRPDRLARRVPSPRSPHDRRPAARGSAVSYIPCSGKLVDPIQAGEVLSDQLIRASRTARSSPSRRGRARPEMVSVAGTTGASSTVLPGLIDMHTHLVDDEQSGEHRPAPAAQRAAQQAYIGAAHARVTLMAGFTSVRDVGTWRAFGDVALRDAIDQGFDARPAHVGGQGLCHRARRRRRGHRPRARRRHPGRDAAGRGRGRRRRPSQGPRPAGPWRSTSSS
ncbi:amidohydrolase family protein [Caulobacter segnis]